MYVKILGNMKSKVVIYGNLPNPGPDGPGPKGPNGPGPKGPKGPGPKGPQAQGGGGPQGPGPGPQNVSAGMRSCLEVSVAGSIEAEGLSSETSMMAFASRDVLRGEQMTKVMRVTKRNDRSA
jgi:hypothetical protein